MGRVKKLWQAQSGSMLLFVAIAVLPAILLLFTMTLGSNTLLHEREHAKQVADAMALFGARSLPMAAQAKLSAEEYFGSDRSLASFVSGQIRDRFTYSVSTSPSEVRVTLTRKRNIVTLHSPLSTLDKLFRASPIDLTYSVQSVAQRNPRNVLLFMDNGDYLAPPLTKGSGSNTEPLTGSDDGEEAYTAAWGQIDQVKENCATWRECAPDDPNCNHTCIKSAYEKAVEMDQRGLFWPASTFPKSPKGRPYFFKRIDTGPSRYRLDRQLLNPLLATQQCFNPSFSALKDATIRMYDYLSSIPQNAVSVMVGPEMTQDATQSKGFRILNTWGSNQTLGIDTYDGEGISDEYCLALAEANSTLSPGGAKCATVNPTTILDDSANESDVHCGYGPPRYSDQLGLDLQLASHVGYNNGKWQSFNISQMPVREAIWARAVARRFRNHAVIERKLALNHAINAATSWLMASPLRTNRASAALDPSYSLYFMLGDLPWTAPAGGGAPERLVKDDGSINSTAWSRLRDSFINAAILATKLKA